MQSLDVNVACQSLLTGHQSPLAVSHVDYFFWLPRWLPRWLLFWLLLLPALPPFQPMLISSNDLAASAAANAGTGLSFLGFKLVDLMLEKLEEGWRYCESSAGGCVPCFPIFRRFVPDFDDFSLRSLLGGLIPIFPLPMSPSLPLLMLTGPRTSLISISSLSCEDSRPRLELPPTDVVLSLPALLPVKSDLLARGDVLPLG